MQVIKNIIVADSSEYKDSIVINYNNNDDVAVKIPANTSITNLNIPLNKLSSVVTIDSKTPSKVSPSIEVYIPNYTGQSGIVEGILGGEYAVICNGIVLSCTEGVRDHFDAAFINGGARINTYQNNDTEKYSYFYKNKNEEVLIVSDDWDIQDFTTPEGVYYDWWETVKKVRLRNMPVYPWSRFQGSKLQYIDAKTGKINSLCFSFHECEELLSADFSEAKIELSETDVSYGFNCCYKLTDLKLMNAECNVLNMEAAFRRCESIESIYIPKYVSKVPIKFSSTFERCYKLKSIDFGQSELKVSTMQSAFSQCYVLQQLDLSNIDISECTSFSTAFKQCNALNRIKFKNLGKFKSNLTIDLSICPLGTLNEQNKQDFINDFVVNSLAPTSEYPGKLTLKFSTATKNLLTDEHKQILTNKFITII